MIAAYRAGSLNGQPFPEGSTIAKIQWKPVKSTEAPFDGPHLVDAERGAVHHQGQQAVRKQRRLRLRPLHL